MYYVTNNNRNSFLTEGVYAEDLIVWLRAIAGRHLKQGDEDFSPDDYAGGNIDDAFYAGESDGEIYIAREVLKRLEEIK